MKIQLSNSKRKILNRNPFIIAALLYGAAIIFSGCETEVEKIDAFSSPETLPTLYAENFESTFIDSFQVESYMKAPVLQQFESDDQNFMEFPKGVLLIRYDKEGKMISRITSDYARQYPKEKKWEAKNNVIAVNEQGDTLKTEYLIWEENSNRIYSDKFVKIIRPGNQIIKGIGFEADQNLQNWTIKNPTGTIYVSVNQDEEKSEQPKEKPSERGLKPVDLGH